MYRGSYTDVHLPNNAYIDVYFHIVLTDKIPLFAWDAYFYTETPTLIIKRGKISLLDGVPIFTAGCQYIL